VLLLVVNTQCMSHHQAAQDRQRDRCQSPYGSATGIGLNHGTPVARRRGRPAWLASTRTVRAISGMAGSASSE
jgi:ribosomal protein L19E